MLEPLPEFPLQFFPLCSRVLKLSESIHDVSLAVLLIVHQLQSLNDLTRYEANSLHDEQQWPEQSLDPLHNEQQNLLLHARVLHHEFGREPFPSHVTSRLALQEKHQIQVQL